MRTYRVTVTQLVSDENLTKHDDKIDNPVGTYDYQAETDWDALSEFHNHIAIGCLEDFNITCDILQSAERVAAGCRHPIADWRHEVANEHTIRGYEDWLDSRIEQDCDALATLTKMTVKEPTVGIVVNAPAVFRRDDFMRWLDQPSGVATWKQVGAKPDEYSDVFVLVDSNYEGDSSDMPQDIWRAVCDLAYAKYCNGKPELSLLHSHIVVRLTNLS